MLQSPGYAAGVGERHAVDGALRSPLPLRGEQETRLDADKAALLPEHFGPSTLSPCLRLPLGGIFPVAWATAAR